MLKEQIQKIIYNSVALKEEKILRKIQQKNIISFDVFDTLVTRKVETPQGIFSVMSEKMLRDCPNWDIPACYLADFRIIRVNAEKQARRFSDAEVTLDDIYRVLGHNYGLSNDVLDRLKKLEVQCELENCTVIKSNIEKIKKALDKK